MAAVHVVDRSAHAVPVEASATVVVAVGDRRAWPRRGSAGLAPEAVAAVVLDGALRLGLAGRALESVVDGPGRALLAAQVRQRVTVDLEPLGLAVLGLWLGEVGDPTGHLDHWAGVRDAAVAAGTRVQRAILDRDATVAEHALSAQGWAAWRVAGLIRERARAEVGAAAGAGPVLALAATGGAEGADAARR